MTERRKHNRVLSRGTEKQKKMNFLYMIKCFHILASQGLMHSSGPVGRHRQLVMVLEGELYLIPFALLKGSSSNEYLYERFSLIAVPSIHGLGTSAKVQLLIKLCHVFTICNAITNYSPSVLSFAVLQGKIC